MMIVLIAISIILIIVCLTTDMEDFVAVPISALCIKIGIMAILMGMIVNGRVLDQKIELIEQKNQEIEGKIEVAVKTYMEYEGETFTNLKSDSYIQLVNLYPELKADELIKSEIELYNSNIKEINDLKMERINISNYKWWAYFGK